MDDLWSSVEGLVSRLFGRNNRRADPLPSPFPPAWQATLDREVPFYLRLPKDEDRTQLRSDVFRFVVEKTWTPFDVEIDDRKKLIIAAHACVLLNGRIDLPVFPRTREIILRSGVFGPRTQSIAPDGRLFESHDARIGEAWYRGPIVLSWEAIEPLTIARYPAHNVIVHEFAHALDHLDGQSDGTPPLETRRALAEWADVFTRAFERLRNAAEDIRSNIIDPYGATNPAEFFAVVSEAFFCRPTLLKRQHPELFEQMRLFFRQDPSDWSD
jgi:Mlc titration factor MtfA (ptsG expression regulator)